MQTPAPNSGEPLPAFTPPALMLASHHYEGAEEGDAQLSRLVVVRPLSPPQQGLSGNVSRRTAVASSPLDLLPNCY